MTSNTKTIVHNQYNELSYKWPNGVALPRPHSWYALPRIRFYQGKTTSYDLADHINNPGNLDITWSMPSRTLPTGVTRDGSVVSYNGSAAVSDATVTFRAAATGNPNADKSVIVEIIDKPDFAFDANATFTDGAESGDHSTTNNDGATWGSLTAGGGLQVITTTERVFPSPTLPKPASQDFSPLVGDKCFRARFRAGVKHVEQRFSLGTEYSELWVGFWIRAPINYSHFSEVTSNNRKLLYIWMDGYSTHGEGPTVGWEFWRVGTISRLAYNARTSGTGALGSEHTGHKGHYDFISWPADTPGDRGRWMQCIMQVVASSNNETSDGIVRHWRRWEDGSFTKHHERTDLLLPKPAETPGWANMYFMGWHQEPFTEDTEYLLDQIQISNSALEGIVP